MAFAFLFSSQKLNVLALVLTWIVYVCVHNWFVVRISAPLALREVGDAINPRRDSSAATRYTPRIPVNCCTDAIIHVLFFKPFRPCATYLANAPQLRRCSS